MKYASLRDGLQLAICPSISGGTGLLPDLSGRGNHGAFNNMTAEDLISKPWGTVLDFDGVDDYISIGRPMPVGNRTISAWFFRPTTTGRRGIFGTRPTGGTAGYFLSTSVTSSGTISYTHPGIAAVTSTGSLWSANVWNHVAVTLTGLAVNIFLNGRSVHTGTVASLETASTVAWIGAEEGPSLEVFEGQLDDIRLYNRSLSIPEIQALGIEPSIGLRPERASVFFGSDVFQAAWLAQSRNIIGGGVC